MSTANSNDDGCARVCARAPFSASAGGVGRCRHPVKLTFLRDSGPLLAVEVILLHIHVASVVHTWRSAMGMQERVCCTPKSLLLRTHSTRPRPELLDTPLRSAGHRDLDAARAARGRRAQAGRGRGGRVLEHKGGREAQVPALQRRVLVRGGRGRMSYASEAANRRAQNVQRSRPSAKVEVPQIPPQAVLAPRAAHSAVTGPGDEHPPELDQLADLLSRHGEMSGSLQV